jgi:hypothetical protein
MREFSSESYYSNPQTESATRETRFDKSGKISSIKDTYKKFDVAVVANELTPTQRYLHSALLKVRAENEKAKTETTAVTSAEVFVNHCSAPKQSTAFKSSIAMFFSQ